MTEPDPQGRPERQGPARSSTSRPEGIHPPRLQVVTPLPPRRRRPVPALAVDLVVGVGFVLMWLNLHTLAVALETAPGASAWYPARGLGLALLLVFGARHVVSLAAASLIGGVAYHLPGHPLHWLLAAGLIAGGTAVAARVLGRAGFRNDMGLRDALLLVAVALPVEAVIAAGVVALNVAKGLLSPQDYPEVVRQFFVGDTLGILIVVPLAVLLARLGGRLGTAGLLPRPRRVVEAALLCILGVVLLALAAGVQGRDDGTVGLLGGWLLLLPLALAALRFGPLGAAIACLALSVGLVLALRWSGLQARTLDLQWLMLAFCAVGLVLGGAVADRRPSRRSGPG